jgi:hypothetical protein
MHFISVVLAFLIFFATLSYLRLDRFFKHVVVCQKVINETKKTREDNFKMSILAFEIKQEDRDSKYEEIKKTLPSNSSSPKLLYLEIPPHNSKLNLAKVFKEYLDVSSIDINEKNHTAVFVRLLEMVYGNYLFFNEVPNASSLIYDWLMKTASLNGEQNKKKIEIFEDIATLEITDTNIKKIFYNILRGIDCPPLQNFVYLDKNRRKFEINIHHAPEELIAAVLNNKEAAKEIVNLRLVLNEIGKRTTKKRKKSLVTTTFLTKDSVESILKNYGFNFCEEECFFDFSTTKPNTKSVANTLLIGADHKGRLRKITD